MDGKCARTAGNDPLVGAMHVFRYPVQERFGLIWAFNGEEPLYDLPDLGFPDEELTFHAEIPHLDLLADPWVFMCNTTDFNHINIIHGIKIEGDATNDINWLIMAIITTLRAVFAKPAPRSNIRSASMAPTSSIRRAA